MRWLAHGGIPVLGFGALRGSLLVGAPRFRLLVSGGVVDFEEVEGRLGLVILGLLAARSSVA